MKEIIRGKIHENLMNINGIKKASGVLIKATETNRVLLLLRNDYPYAPNTWSMVSGTIETGESSLEGLKREVNEELSIDPNIITYRFMGSELLYNKISFTWYEGLTHKEFIPKLDEENLDYGWFDINNLPEPLYPGTLDKIKMI